MDFDYQFKSSSTYELKHKIGAGGLSEVFLYTRKTEGLPDQDVVLKIIRRQDSESFDELVNDGQRLSELKHPSIVSTYGYEKTYSGKFALMLEYVPGSNLKTIIPFLPELQKHSLACYIIKSACEAMVLAHAKGVVHGDLSGRNILVSNDGQIKLTDFGLAPNELGNVKKMIKNKGSIDYLAPERWRGEIPTQSSDVFSLGILALEILEGKDPLQFSSPQNAREELAHFLINPQWTKHIKWAPFFKGSLQYFASDRASMKELLELIPQSLLPDEEMQDLLSHTIQNTSCLQPKQSTMALASYLTGKVNEPKVSRNFGVSSLVLMLLFFSFRTAGVDGAIRSNMRPFLLTVTSEPWGEVLIDGKSQGYTPVINLPVSPGEHSINWCNGKNECVQKSLAAYQNGVVTFQISGRPVLRQKFRLRKPNGQ